MKDIKLTPVENPEKFTGKKMMTDDVLKSALNAALIKIDKLWEDVHGKCAYADSVNNIYPEAEIEQSGWYGGFTTGLLWLAYEAAGDEKYKERALSHIPAYFRRIDEKIRVESHDMGFLYVPSCVAAYKLCGDELGKKSAIMAADQLLRRYREEGGYLQAWGAFGEQDRIIIDCMNNIPLLFWASEVTGDKNYYEKALSHAKVTMDTIVREDASTFHTFYFNSDGTPDKGTTAQGASDDSCWARGQAWMISGLPLSYKYTKDEEMVELFCKVTNYFLNYLPKDLVPYWDLSFTDGSGEPRDSSAAAIAVCGILEMLPYIRDERLKEIYEGAVDKIMYSLYENYSTKNDESSNGLLTRAIYTRPGGSKEECNIWGCYYYMEALLRMTMGKKGYW